MEVTRLELEALEPRAGRLAGVRNTFLFQAAPSEQWVVGGRWWGRAPGFPTEQYWVITKVRRRGRVVKVWGVQDCRWSRTNRLPAAERR